MKRGDVRWYKFAQPDKTRPVVILTRDSAIEYLSELTVAQITTTVRDIPSQVQLNQADGMPRACAVNCDHLHTVSKARLGSHIATLSASRLAEVAEAVSFALALTD